jgi:hypothetical protein
MDTLKIWERLSMEVTGRIAPMGGTRSVSPPVGVGMVARIGDKSVLVIPTVTGVVLRARIVEGGEVMITGTTNVIGGRPRLSRPPVTQKARRVKGRTPGTLRIPMHQRMSQHRETMTFR